MEFLTEQQVKEIGEIIEKHVGVLLFVFTGEKKVDPKLLKKLRLPENTPSILQNVYVLGKLIQLMGEENVEKMSYEELKKKAQEISLTEVERNSLKYSQQHAGEYITALGRKMNQQVKTQILQTSKNLNLEVAQRQIVRDTVAQAILKRQTRGKLASELLHNLQDWERDWKRVAHTELWNTKLQGEVVSILQGNTIYKNTKGGDTLVYRRPSPDACQHCKRLYLENDGVTPKIFKLSELIANGDNVGRKAKDWLPTTTTTHPNCTCPIAVLPDGFGFDSRGNLVFKG